VTEDGREVRADLVVDAAGRRSSLPRLLDDIGACAPVEELDDCGFVYYGRHFHSSDGSLPPAFGPPLQAYDSISILTLPADNGTWGVGIVASAHDAVLRKAHDPDVWARVLAAYPLVAHWGQAEPISDVAVMAKIEDRHRTFVVDGVPVATGVIAVGDSWACTNPSVGRGASIGLKHAVALRDHLRKVPLDDPVVFATEWHETTLAEVEPHYRETLAFDHHRLAEIDAEIAGRPYETDDPGWVLGTALENAASRDHDLLRHQLEIPMLLATGQEVLSRPGVVERALELRSEHEPGPGPSRVELVALVGA
jgi:flavin-dependent dehydrogenase